MQLHVNRRFRQLQSFVLQGDLKTKPTQILLNSILQSSSKFKFFLWTESLVYTPNTFLGDFLLLLYEVIFLLYG